MLKQRITTALVLLPVVILLFFFVPLNFFSIAIGIIVFMVAIEWARLTGVKTITLTAFYAILISGLNFLIWQQTGDFKFWPSLSWPNALAWDLPMLVLVAGIIAVFISIFIVFTYSTLPKWWANSWAIGVLGILLLPALFVALISIRKTGYLVDFHRGGGLVLFMFLLIWAADTGAYFSGKAFGKTKLAPVVSPNKTWEGVIGGLLLSVLVGWAGALILGFEIGEPLLYTSVLLCLAGISVVGDLFESAMKRVANIKDSGNLLPGHGGFLDRLDSTIAVAPIFFLSFTYFGWF
ncbi:MAG: phosphatidate cytidylyltransferase [Kangiellaceae bacterium]|nr:phosphatidate cytidylyltransferase [Kangiellaceae bacterium]MCW9000461.1 phosphatidate cytidylyltransferase [Kangiellaceae bacterium]